MSAHLDKCDLVEQKKFCCQFDGCLAAFVSKAAVHKHVRKVHASPVKCPHKHCSSQIKPSSLIQHLKAVHEKVKKTCQHCKKQMSYVSFGAHVKRCTSDGERKFSCTFEGCKTKFATANDRSTHVSHVHKPRVKCLHKNCTVMIKRANLIEHLKTVHKRYKKSCQYCEKQISYRYLKRHMERCSSDGKK